MNSLTDPITAIDEDRGALAQMLMRLFDLWQLGTEDQAALLGLAPQSRATLARYRRGEAIGTSRDQLERVTHLLACHRLLRLLFPEHRDLAYAWMRTPNRAFDGRSPVQRIAEDGFAGLLMVRAYLENVE